MSKKHIAITGSQSGMGLAFRILLEKSGYILLVLIFPEKELRWREIYRTNRRESVWCATSWINVTVNSMA